MDTESHLEISRDGKSVYRTDNPLIVGTVATAVLCLAASLLIAAFGMAVAIFATVVLAVGLHRFWGEVSWAVDRVVALLRRR